MVYFTVFLQGGTIKLLVEKLHIEKEKENVRLISDDVNLKTIDLLMSGVGAILGRIHYNELLENFQLFDKKYIKKWLVRDNVLDPMTKHFNQIAIQEHYTRLYHPIAEAQQNALNNVLPTTLQENDILTIPTIKIDVSNDNTDIKTDSIDQRDVKDQEKKIFELGGDVLMDKLMLQNAFAHNAYDRRRRSQYDSVSVFGSVKTRHNSDDHLENVLKEHKEKTNAIKKSAFSRRYSQYQ